MAKEKLFSGFLEHKVLVGFCSAMALGLTLFILLYVPYRLGEPLDHRLVGDCKPESLLELKVLANEEHIREVVENLGKHSSSSSNSSSNSSSKTLPVEQENSTALATESSKDSTPEIVVKEIREWELAAITDDRPNEKLDDEETYGEARRFKPMGSGAFLFIQFGAYRGGSNSFAVVGLGAKPLHVFGNPGFECMWISNSNNSEVLVGNATKYLPDWGYGRQYTVVVVNCTFDSDVGVDGSGGRLEMVANRGSQDHTGLPDVPFVALTEEAKEYDGSIFEAPYKYDYLYCGSPLFGSISPQRIREWITYHVWLFGPRSHFILYDAGGIHEEVRRILEPWIKLGFVSVMNIRQESRYDVYYYSQFLINNDCVFRAKTLANWTFFFDVDEYIHVPSYLTFDQVMSDFYQMGRRAQQVVYQQYFMNHDHCVSNDSLSSDELQRKWGFEKLVYRRTQYTHDFGFPNRKYAIQAKYALATGVHNSENTLVPDGMKFQKTIHYDGWRMQYYHYHNTIDHREELCKQFVDPSLNNVTKLQKVTHEYNDGMAVLADAVREFELRTVGPQPFLP